METTQIIIAVLRINKSITDNEADILCQMLKHQNIPDTWQEVILQFEEIIGRDLK